MAKVFRVTRDPLKAQSFRTQRPESPEDLSQPLYDRVNVATTVPAQLSFFSVPKGQTATLIVSTAAVTTKSKTYRDTNMENAGVIPTKMFKVIGISTAIVHSTRQAVANAGDRAYVTDGGYLQVRIVDKDLLFLPLIAVPVLNPIAAVATTANASTMFADNPGGGVGSAMYRLPIPITINPYENFTVTVNYDRDNTITLGATLDMYMFFHSMMRRPT